MIPGQQALEETLCGASISALLQQHIDNFAILIDRPPQIPLLASDSNEDPEYIRSTVGACRLSRRWTVTHSSSVPCGRYVAGITGSPVATTLERISYDVSAGFLFR